MDVLGYNTQTHTHLVLQLPVAQKSSGTVGVHKDPAVLDFNWEHLEMQVNYRLFSPRVRTCSLMSPQHLKLMSII